MTHPSREAAFALNCGESSFTSFSDIHLIASGQKQSHRLLGLHSCRREHSNRLDERGPQDPCRKLT